MLRREMLVGLAFAGLSACSTGSAARIGANGLPLPQVYNIKAGDEGDIQFRMLDSINTLRAAAGAPPLELDANLTAAAATHSRDMSAQNRPWLFGSDGSSPLDRARNAGFRGRVVGENISESFETELQTLAAWMNQPDTRAVILDRDARRMGFAWFQEPQGKLWWTLSLGTAPIASAPIASTAAPDTTTATNGFQLGNF